MPYGNRKRKTRGGMFRTQSHVEPAVVVQEIDLNHPEENPVEYVQIIKPKKAKKRKYLPGERLLIKLEKQREKEKNKLRNTESQVNVDKLTESINHILAKF